MRFDLYQAETRRHVAHQSALLDEAHERLVSGGRLSLLEQAGLLHALQVLIENAIGKVKHLLKARGEEVPISAYDAFARASALGLIDPESLEHWNAIVGIRNRIVHDYLNLDMAIILGLVSRQAYRFVTAFLLDAIDSAE